MLRETTIAKQASIGVFEGLDDFLGALKLLEGTLNRDIALSIQADAGIAFASPETRRGFLYDKGVLSQILHELHDKFYEVSEANYRRRGDERMVKASTSFVDWHSKDVYQWKTQLEFGVEFASIVGTGGIKKTIRVSVVWNARFADAKFSDFEFKSLAPEGESSSVITSAVFSGTMENLAATHILSDQLAAASGSGIAVTYATANLDNHMSALSGKLDALADIAWPALAYERMAAQNSAIGREAERYVEEQRKVAASMKSLTDTTQAAAERFIEQERRIAASLESATAPYTRAAEQLLEHERKIAASLTPRISGVPPDSATSNPAEKA